MNRDDVVALRDVELASVDAAIVGTTLEAGRVRRREILAGLVGGAYHGPDAVWIEHAELIA